MIIFLQLFGVTESGNNGPCADKAAFTKRTLIYPLQRCLAVMPTRMASTMPQRFSVMPLIKHPTQGDVRWDQEARWYADTFDRSMAESGRGVALVRDTVAPAQPVNAPTTLGLMAIAWLALRFGYQR